MAKLRTKLNQDNLYGVYRGDHKTLKGKVVTCSKRALAARTDDGTCNNLKAPAMGAKDVAFGRNVPLKSVIRDGRENIFKPNPMLVSQELLRRDKFKPVPFLNLIATSWLQFMNHDWFFHGKNASRRPYRVKSSGSGHASHPAQGSASKIPRTSVDQKLWKQRKSALPKKIYRNAVTHWWDGSQVYGSDAETVAKLRAHKDGKMKINSQGILPRDKDGMEIAGFKDNWWLGLSMLHHLFVMEHNSIAEALKKNYPDWSDQKLFDTARLVNAAVMAKIHTVEWTPGILPNEVLKAAMYTNWYGLGNPKTIAVVGKLLDSNRNLYLCEVPGVLASLRRTLGRFTKWLTKGQEEHAEYGTFSKIFQKYPILHGLVGGKTELHGMPFSITEEFVTVYRMHPLLPEDFKVFKTTPQGGKPVGVIPLNETRHEKSLKLVNKYGLEDLFYSFSQAHPGSLTLKNYPKFMSNLHVPENPFGTKTVDLGAVDILRDRERGVPRYNEFRRLLGLGPIQEFEDLFVDPVRPETQKNLKNPENIALLEKLKEIYDNDVEKMDVLVGTLGENIRPDGYGFGETAFQIFALMASRRLQADRFFTEDYRAEIYTDQGLQWIDDATMKGVILRHFPKLSPALKGVDNAFSPWKTL